MNIVEIVLLTKPLLICS